MTQFVVSDLEDDVRDILCERAQQHGHSVEEEICDILRAATAKQQNASSSGSGLGSRIARRFADCGLDKDIPEWRGESIQTPSNH